MSAMLVVKTANGYAVMPYTSPIPQCDMAELRVATVIDDSSWSYRGKTVTDILKAQFEPIEPAVQEAA